MRDGFRCAISGAYDRETVEKYPEIEPPDSEGLLFTECCHIFSEGTLQSINTKPNKVC